MSIRDIFKKEKKKKKPVEVKKEPIKEMVGGQVPSKETSKIKREVKFDQAYRVLKMPQITEKATALTKENQYVFKVYPKTNKFEIKKAIEGLYDVDVLSVKIVKIPRKKRRLGRTLGWRKGYKKAIVKIKKGQKIEIISI